MNDYRDILAHFLSWSVGFIMGMGVATLIHAMAMASVGRLDDDDNDRPTL